jgi:hypothetical protein
MGRVNLSVYMDAQMRAAMEDTPTAPVGELYERFLVWVRPATAFGRAGELAG